MLIAANSADCCKRQEAGMGYQDGHRYWMLNFYYFISFLLYLSERSTYNKCLQYRSNILVKCLLQVFVMCMSLCRDTYGGACVLRVFLFFLVFYVVRGKMCNSFWFSKWFNTMGYGCHGGGLIQTNNELIASSSFICISNEMPDGEKNLIQFFIQRKITNQILCSNIC